MGSRPFAAISAGTVTGEVSERLAIVRSIPFGRRPDHRDRRREGRPANYTEILVPVSDSLPTGGGDVVLDALPGFLDLRDQVVEVPGTVDEVDVVGVHDEKRRL